MHTPETHFRARVQRVIRMGEWLQRNEAMLIALYDAIDDAHTDAIDMELDDTIILETLVSKQAAPLRALGTVIRDLRNSPDWGVESGKDVTLYHPNACPNHRHEVVLKAPKANTEETK